MFPAYLVWPGPCLLLGRGGVCGVHLPEPQGPCGKGWGMVGGAGPVPGREPLSSWGQGSEGLLPGRLDTGASTQASCSRAGHHVS